jgi:hypothetical protein
VAVEMVRVWANSDAEVQHLTQPPGDDTAHRWTGVTVCGIEGEVTWVLPEHVDAGMACPACASVTGFAPALEGDDPGPV